MRFADVKELPDYCSAVPTGTLELFSFKIAGISKELQWPLNVYGLIAIRDHLDRKRNIVFARDRSNCQTITAEVCLLGYSLLYFGCCSVYSFVAVNYYYLLKEHT
jgi:hypothetical protein